MNYANILNKAKQPSKVDFTELASFITDKAYRNNMLGDREAYQLLARFSLSMDDINILDVGTKRGCSAFALSVNKLNTVHSFDIVDQKMFTQQPDNVVFYLGDCTEDKYYHIVKESRLVYLDTYHNGIFEKKFHEYLKSIKWYGIVIYDDIKLNDNMNNFWSGIKEEKYDLTQWGHWSGTGVVIFNE